MTTQAPDKSPAPASPAPSRAQRSPRTGPVATDYEGDARQLVEMVSSFLCSLSPDAKNLWTDETCQNIATALEAVMKKHAWRLEDLSPEIRLLLAAGPALLAASGPRESKASQQPVAPPQPRRRAGDPPPERRAQAERRSSQKDRRVSTVQNLIRPYRWHQFKP